MDRTSKILELIRRQVLREEPDEAMRRKTIIENEFAYSYVEAVPVVSREEAERLSLSQLMLYYAMSMRPPVIGGCSWETFKQTTRADWDAVEKRWVYVAAGHDERSKCGETKKEQEKDGESDDDENGTDDGDEEEEDDDEEEDEDSGDEEEVPGSTPVTIDEQLMAAEKERLAAERKEERARVAAEKKKERERLAAEEKEERARLAAAKRGAAADELAAKQTTPKENTPPATGMTLRQRPPPKASQTPRTPQSLKKK